MAEEEPVATLGAIVRKTALSLDEAGIPDARLDARVLALHMFGLSTTDLIARPDMRLDPGDVARFENAVRRRADGEPVHRIIGHREFYGLPFRLAAATLEPRSDTEILVDHALRHVRATVLRSGTCRILDLGTGSGCIAISILANAPGVEAVAVDLSEDALAAASTNADMIGVADRISFVRCSWFEAIEGRFDLIVSNPPYIPSDEIEMLDREVAEHDPRAALDGGRDGLDSYRALAAGARAHLLPSGRIAVEIGIGQGPSVVELFGGKGYRLVESGNDLSGVKRVLVFEDGRVD